MVWGRLEGLSQCVSLPWGLSEGVCIKILMSVSSILLYLENAHLNFLQTLWGLLP